VASPEGDILIVFYRVASPEGDILIVFYYLCTYKIWPSKRGGFW